MYRPSKINCGALDTREDLYRVSVVGPSDLGRFAIDVCQDAASGRAGPQWPLPHNIVRPRYWSICVGVSTSR